MVVDVFNTDAKGGVQLVLPVGCVISELAPEIKAGIAKLGKLRKSQTIDLTSKPLPLYKETMETIKKQGAHLWKTEIRFEEQIGRP